MRGNRPQWTITCHQMKLALSYIRLMCCPEGPIESSNNPGYCQDYIVYPLKTNGKSPISGDNTYTSLWIQESWAESSLQPSLLWTSIHGTRRYSAHHQRRKVNTNSVTNPSMYRSDLFTRYENAVMEQSSWELSQWWTLYPTLPRTWDY